MKAAYLTKYGPFENLEIKNLPKPIPRENELLIRNYASSINFGNAGHIKGEPFFIRMFTGFGKPKLHIPGGDVAGVVEAVGSLVTQFKPGDKVMGDTASSGFGAYAEYVIAPEEVAVPMPAKLSFSEAATLPLAAAVALSGLEKGKVSAGQRVLIVGSTGSVGPFAVQIAKAKGAQVTAVCSGKHTDYVRSLGADQIIDYKTEDFSKQNIKYDLIVAIGGFRPILVYRSVLKPTGKYVLIGGQMKQFSQAMTFGPILTLLSKQTFTNLMYKANKESLLKIKKLVEEGKIKIKIDKIFPLDQIVDAFKYYELGKVAGKIVIKIP